MRVRSAWVAFALAALNAALVSAGNVPTRSSHKRGGPPPGFVHTQGKNFMLDGKPFFHFASTAYWLSSLNDDDITTTISAMNATGINVIRTWAFNDVTEDPADGLPFFATIHPNGTVQVNEGPNGIQRLDKVIGEAEKFGIKVQLTLTNNWNPVKPPPNNSTRQAPRGFLSNDYGGMDTYVRTLVDANGTHEQFFTNETIKNAFKSYLNTIITRYKDNSTVFGWELANDPRCNGTQPNAPECESRNVTSWVADISSHVKNLDPHHIVSAGSGGFMCMNCPKLFPPRNPPKPPPPVVSPAPGQRKRQAPEPLTAGRVRAARTELLRKWEGATASKDGRLVRGRWAAPTVRRQAGASMQGTAFDGSQGVDSGDINNVPTVDISTFQLFPDQNSYMGVSPTTPNVDPATMAQDEGNMWIQMNAAAANDAGIPSALTAFGLVPTTSAGNFVPFNQSSTTVADVIGDRVQIVGATPQQQTTTYTSWINSAVQQGVGGIGQYQWTQNLPGSTSPLVTQSPLNTPMDQSQLTPDDGYPSSDADKQAFQNGANQQAAQNT